jgi:hypothetical protein
VARFISTSSVLIALLCVGCITTYREVPQFNERFGEIRTVTLVPPKVAVYTITAGGVIEEVSEWTQSAHQLLTAELEREIQERGNLEFVPYYEQVADEESVADDANSGEVEGWTPLEENWALFEAAAMAIYQHTYDPNQTFKQRKENFDYTLGSESSALVEGLGVDAFLIVVATDYVETAGRQALKIFGALVSGVTGAYVGPKASPTHVVLALVEARTGDILWFNVVDSPGADLRVQANDAKLVDTVMKGLKQKKK